MRETIVEVRRENRGVDKNETKDINEYGSKVEKVSRLLSTRYGRTCFDVIIAKTPNTACVHEVQLKFLQD